MWKRWSIKSPIGLKSEESQPVHSPNKDLSTNRENEPLDEGINEESPQLPTGAKSSTEQMDEKPEAHGIGTRQLPIAQDDDADGTSSQVAELTGNAADLRTEPADVSTTPADPSIFSPTAPFPSALPSPISPKHVALPAEANSEDTVLSSNSDVEGNIHVPPPASTLSAPGFQPQSLPARARRLSFRSFAFFYGRDKQPSITSPSSPMGKTQTKDHIKSSDTSKPKLSRAQKEALSSAIILRTLMIGPGTPSSPSGGLNHLTNIKSRHSKSSTITPPSSNLKKVKAQLLKPKTANAIISQLRRLPLPDGPSFHASGRASSESLVTHPDAGGAPIHAVCLACTDEEADETHFSRLRTGHNLSAASPLSPDALSAASSLGPSSIGTASLESLIPVLRGLRLVSLLASPDLGFGQPVSDNGDIGPLTGSVPSAEVLVDGFEQITKQLIMLGFATSKAVFPSHEGIHPPTDRMSVLTYWWGLELVLPEPSIVYLGKAKSISNTLLNFLSALAMFNNGVREVLPFIRYVANFVDFEWSAIKAQDKGQGVVCAATWVMPAAMVPRPWDFLPRPAAAPSSPTSPPDPAIPKATTGKGDKAGETGAPANPPRSDGPTPPDLLHPVAPAIPMMPQLMITPATLPRSFSNPQEAAV